MIIGSRLSGSRPSSGRLLPDRVHRQGAQDGGPDIEIGGKRRLEFGDVGPPAFVQALRDLVDVVADAAAFTEKLTQGSVIGRGAALGAGTGVAEGGGAHESAGGEAAAGGESVEGVAFVFAEDGR